MDSVRQYSSYSAWKKSSSLSTTQNNNFLDEQWSMGDTQENMDDIFSGTGGSLNDLYDSFQNGLTSIRVTRSDEDRSTSAGVYQLHLPAFVWKPTETHIQFHGRYSHRKHRWKSYHHPVSYRQKPIPSHGEGKHIVFHYRNGAHGRRTGDQFRCGSEYEPQFCSIL